MPYLYTMLPYCPTGAPNTPYNSSLPPLWLTHCTCPYHIANVSLCRWFTNHLQPANMIQESGGCQNPAWPLQDERRHIILRLPANLQEETRSRLGTSKEKFWDSIRITSWADWWRCFFPKACHYILEEVIASSDVKTAMQGWKEHEKINTTTKETWQHQRNTVIFQ